MSDHRFCSMCGVALTELHLPTEERPRLVCLSCGHIHYINPKVVCGTLIESDGCLWLLRRGIEPRLGYWAYPAGFQEWDESSEEAARRETREEIRCDVNIQGLFGVYSAPNAPVVNIVYRAALAADSLPPSITREALEVRKFGPSDIPWLELAFDSTRAVLQDWVMEFRGSDL